MYSYINKLKSKEMYEHLEDLENTADLYYLLSKDKTYDCDLRADYKYKSAYYNDLAREYRKELEKRNFFNFRKK